MNESSDIYRKGDIVHIDQLSKQIGRYLGKVERTLGLEKDEVRQAPEIFMGDGPKCDYERNLVVFPLKTHEAMIEHEMAHLILGKDGFNFDGGIGRRSRYHSLFSETMAEGTAMQNYGCRKDDRIKEVRKMNMVDKLRKKKGNQFMRGLYELGDPGMQLTLIQKTGDDLIANGRSNKDMEAMRDKYVVFAKKNFPFELPLVESQVNMRVAMLNARGFVRNKIKVKDLVNQLRDYHKAGKNAEQFYKEVIAKKTVL